MYSIFIHISGISILEILFYFLYIGPFESAMFKRSFRYSLKSLLNSEPIPNPRYLGHFIHTQNIYNISDDNYWDSYIYSLEMIANEAEKERLKQNNIVFTKTMIYWIIFFAFSIVIFIYFNFYKKYHKKKNQFIHKRLENSERKENKSNNKNLYKIFHYLILGGLIVVFEYVFFQFCVLKYKIISNDELKYLIMDQLGLNFYN